MRVLVTGGTGYLGSAIVRALVAGGHKVTGVSRSPEAAKKLAALNAHARPGTLEEPASIARAAEGHEALVHVAAASGPDRARIDREAILAVIEAARASGESRVVVYTSGVWALGEGGGDEGTPIVGLTDEMPGVALHRPARYSAHRPALEREVLAAATDKLATAVVRPGMVYGGAEGIAWFLFEQLARAAGHPGTAAFVGDGKNRWSPIHRDDNAQLYKAIVEKRATGIFHAVEDQPLSVAELARGLSEAGRTPPPIAWDRAAAVAALGEMGEALALDIPVSAPRSKSIGWTPTHRFSAELNQTWKDFKGAS